MSRGTRSILREASERMSTRAIARDLTAGAMPTAQCAASWTHQTVQAVLAGRLPERGHC
ncbi:recombinase family protein [Agrococcus sp. Ld7]|uniref:recombinase family protein n=1 Tax=Agrococcus sp. Ld7 TaxID=649148 RepID=UPI0038656E1D